MAMSALIDRECFVSDVAEMDGVIWIIRFRDILNLQADGRAIYQAAWRRRRNSSFLPVASKPQ